MITHELHENGSDKILYQIWSLVCFAGTLILVIIGVFEASWFSM